MEAEVRAILHDTLVKPASRDGLGRRTHQRFAAIGGVEIAQPERTERPRPTKFFRVIVLDTDVVLELMRPAPAHAVVAWVGQQPADEAWLMAVTLAELLYGIGRLPGGRRKVDLAIALDAMIADDFDHRIAAFDEPAAAHYADIVVVRERNRRPITRPTLDRGDLPKPRRAPRHAQRRRLRGYGNHDRQPVARPMTALVARYEQHGLAGLHGRNAGLETTSARSAD